MNARPRAPPPASVSLSLGTVTSYASAPVQRRDPGPDTYFHGAPEPQPAIAAYPTTSGTSSWPPRAEEPQAPISVAELDRRLKRLVEGATQDARVLGEVSGYRLHSSGHAYFSLKDEAEDACIDCVMYRTAPERARKMLADGARVVVIARATVYPPRGKLQLVVTDVRPAGRGALLEALERLKHRLAGEGSQARDCLHPNENVRCLQIRR
jgi:exodeoxyribonuclease VII large subunit